MDSASGIIEGASRRGGQDGICKGDGLEGAVGAAFVWRQGGVSEGEIYEIWADAVEANWNVPGWCLSAARRYAVLISFSVADFSRPSTSYGLISSGRSSRMISSSDSEDGMMGDRVKPAPKRAARQFLLGGSILDAAPY